MDINQSLTFESWYPWIDYIFDTIVIPVNQYASYSISSFTENDLQNIIYDYQESQVNNQENNMIY